MSDGAWNYYRVRAGYRRGFIAGMLTCGGVTWACYILGFGMSATIATMTGGALISFVVERIAARIAAKDYRASW